MLNTHVVVAKCRYSLAAMLACFVLLFSGCSGSSSNDNNGGGGDATQTLSGTAATGAAIVGFVYVVDANGIEVNVAINTDGSFSVDVTGATGPFLLRAIPNDTSLPTEYSYAASGNGKVNITSLTTMALWLANDQSDLDTLASNWASDSDQITTQSLDNAMAVVNANFATQYADQGLDATTYDFFTTAFNANSTGIDAMLDELDIDINMAAGTVAVLVGGSSFLFDIEVDVSGGINLGGTPVSGNWTLTTSGTYSVFGMTADFPIMTYTNFSDTAPTLSDVQSEVEVYEANDVVITLVIDTATQKRYSASFSGMFGGVAASFNMVYDYTLQ